MLASSDPGQTRGEDVSVRDVLVPIRKAVQGGTPAALRFDAATALALLRDSETVPLLIEVGDDDGTVAWYQGIELYNIARRAKKNVVMLAYMGEGHGLRQEKNQKDYELRNDAYLAAYPRYWKYPHDGT